MKAFSGTPSPLGFSVFEERMNFAVFSEHAERMFLGIFTKGKGELLEEFALHRTGNMWHVALEGTSESLSYAFRAEGEFGKELLYDGKRWLADPYAKAIDSQAKWGTRTREEPSVRALVERREAFDWQGVEAPRIADEDLIIYEMHVRGFTQHPSSGAKCPGTYLGLVEKISYLKKLGVNAVELMPIFEFDETHSKNVHPQTGQRLVNYWGYSPLHFFAPMRRYGVQNPILECKTMIRELHREGILVLLDVVYNHTGEGKEKDYYVHFRGLDNSVYYQVLPTGEYRDNTGCGHNVNANHPQVSALILDSLRYWAEEMHVDGFRFDLCAALIRGPDGNPMTSSPLIKAISQDRVLKQKRLIAEAWDASGLYLLGQFAGREGWKEWNGQYRDCVRRFLKGTDDCAGSFADALSGSERIYGPSHTPLSSINFITAHDGYSLKDLVSYQQKHNWENGEQNRDGSDQNENWNCGAEGATDKAEVLELRERQMRNFLVALFVSQGIPMLLMGDEYGHTRKGNNNPYVQDNAINWFLWDQMQEDQLAFVSALIKLRKSFPCFRKRQFLTPQDITWHGHNPNQPDWSPSSRFVAYTIGPFYIAFNADYNPASLVLPSGAWQSLIQTEISWDKQPLLQKTKAAPSLIMPPHSSYIFIDQNKNHLLQ